MSADLVLVPDRPPAHEFMGFRARSNIRVPQGRVRHVPNIPDLVLLDIDTLIDALFREAGVTNAGHVLPSREVLCKHVYAEAADLAALRAISSFEDDRVSRHFVGWVVLIPEGLSEEWIICLNPDS